MPKANRDYWRQKIAKNRIRDEKYLSEYAARGWDLLTVWECETHDREALASRLRAFLNVPAT
jgi:DNA mismatch endonuclease (patch repair protein)